MHVIRNTTNFGAHHYKHHCYGCQQAALQEGLALQRVPRVRRPLLDVVLEGDLVGVALGLRLRLRLLLLEILPRSGRAVEGLRMKTHARMARVSLWLLQLCGTRCADALFRP